MASNKQPGQNPDGSPHQLPVHDIAHNGRSEGGVVAAIEYLHKEQRHWVLDPAVVTVTQPNDQEGLIGRVDKALAIDTGVWSENSKDCLHVLDDNLFSIEQFSSDDFTPNVEFLRIDMAHLQGIETDEAYEEAKQKHDNLQIEHIESPDSPNLMLNGLLAITGAECIRDDIQDGNTSGTRVYKGMFEGNEVHFVESLTSASFQKEGKKISGLKRAVYLSHGAVLEDALNDLSDKDKTILRAANLESSVHNRRTMAVRLQQIERRSRIHDRRKALPSISALEVDKVLMGIVIAVELEKQEAAELQRGRLFPTVHAYREFSELYKHMPKEEKKVLAMGTETGFEQGEDVSVLSQKRDGTYAEEYWTFLGQDKTSGRIIVGTQTRDAETDEIHRHYASRALDDIQSVKRAP